MINKVSFAAPQYQQKPAFKGEKEVKEIVKEAASIDLDNDPYASNALGNLMVLLNRSEKEDIEGALKSEDIDTRIKNLMKKKAEM